MLHTTLDEALTGRTLGKRMMHCRVVSVDGSKPNVSQVVSRALLKLVKLIAPLMLLLLFVLPLLNPYSQRLGDILGRTVVISEPPAGAETGSNSEGEEPDEQEPSD